jgi:hypothetical protein
MSRDRQFHYTQEFTQEQRKPAPVVRSDHFAQPAKFASALCLERTYAFRDECLNGQPLTHASYDKRLLSVHHHFRAKDGLQVGVEIWPRVFGWRSKIRASHLGLNHSKSIDAAMRALEMQEGHILQMAPAEIVKEFLANKTSWGHNIERQMAVDTEMVRLAFLHDFCDFMVNAMRDARADNYSVKDKGMRMAMKAEKTCTSSDLLPGVTFITCCNHGILKYESGMWLVSNDQVLMMHNKSAELMSAYMMAKLCENVTYLDGGARRAFSLFKYMMKLVELKKNKAYNCIIGIEGLICGSVMAEIEEWDNTGFLREAWEELSAEFFPSERNFHDSALGRLIKAMPLPERMDFLGWIKIAGHPDIDTDVGITQMHKRTHRDIPILPADAQAVANELMWIFCDNYVAKHNKWPRVVMHPGCPPRFAIAIMRGWLVTDKRLDTYKGNAYDAPSLNDWDYVDLGKMAEFDYIDSVIPLLKDRSIAPLRTRAAWEIGASIEEKIKDSRKKKKVEKLKESRVLLTFLFTSFASNDLRSYCRKYADNPVSCLEYLVIKLTRKDRELKVKGRFFGQSPLLERNRRIATEHNMHGFLDVLSSQQAMTISELARIRRVYAFSTMNKKLKDYKVMLLSLDIEGWCSSFRDAVVRPCMSKVGDPYFGFTTPLYANTMSAYEHSLIYCPTYSKTYYWQGQAGGIEGLNQYVWEACFLGCINRMMKEFELNYKVISVGDDIRIALFVPNAEIEDKQVFTARREEWKNRIADLGRKYGLIVKVSETFMSVKFFGFSKNFLIEGIWMPNLIKKSIKICGFSNQTLPFLDTQVGMTFANAHSACGVGTVHHIPWFMAAYWSCYHWFKADPEHPPTVTEMVHMLLTPSVLGGYPVLPLIHFYVRGESDLLPVGLSIMRFIIYQYPQHREWAWNVMRLALSTPNYEMLFSDPYSISRVSVGQKPEGLLKNKMHEMLPKHVVNMAIKDLLTAEMVEDKAEFLKCLASCRPLPVKPLSTLWECSIFNIIPEILSAFENSRSIFEFLVCTMKYKEVNKFIRKCLTRDVQRFRKIRRWFVGEFSELEDNVCGMSYEVLVECRWCPTELAQKFRDLSWENTVTTITQPCIVDQLELMRIGDLALDISRGQRSFEYRIDLSTNVEFPVGMLSHHYCLGPSKVFHGQNTVEKVVAENKPALDEYAPIMTKLSKLLTLRAYASILGAVIVQIVDDLAHDLIGDTWVQLIECIPRVQSGSLTHRFRAKGFENVIMPNRRDHMTSLVFSRHDTNMHTRGAAGDWSINYVMVMIQVQSVLLMPLQYASLMPLSLEGLYYGVLNIDNCCYYEVTDRPIEEMKEAKRFRHPKLATNPLVRATAINLQRIHERLQELHGNKVYRWVNEEDNMNPGQADVIREVAQNVVMQKLIKQSDQFSDAMYTQAQYIGPGGQVESMRVPVDVHARMLYMNLSGINLTEDIGMTEMNRLSAGSYLLGICQRMADLIPSMRPEPYTESDLKGNVMSRLYPSIGPGLLTMIINSGMCKYLLQAMFMRHGVPAPTDAHKDPHSLNHHFWRTMYRDAWATLCVHPAAMYPYEKNFTMHQSSASVLRDINQWLKQRVGRIMSELLPSNLEEYGGVTVERGLWGCDLSEDDRNRLMAWFWGVTHMRYNEILEDQVENIMETGQHDFYTCRMVEIGTRDEYERWVRRGDTSYRIRVIGRPLFGKNPNWRHVIGAMAQNINNVGFTQHAAAVWNLAAEHMSRIQVMALTEAVQRVRLMRPPNQYAATVALREQLLRVVPEAVDHEFLALRYTQIRGATTVPDPHSSGPITDKETSVAWDWSDNTPDGNVSRRHARREHVSISYLLRTIGAHSSAAAKLVEMIDLMGIKGQLVNLEHANYAATADGNGAWSLFFASLNDTSRCMYNTYSDRGTLALGRDQFGEGEYTPPAITSHPMYDRLSASLLNWTSCSVGGGDLSNADVIRVINGEVTHLMSPGLVGITCDAEGKDDPRTDRQISCGIVSMAIHSLRLNGFLILKWYYPVGDWRSCVLTLLAYLFRDVSLVKPLSSHERSTEFYLICTGRRGSPLASEAVSRMLERVLNGELFEPFRPVHMILRQWRTESVRIRDNAVLRGITRLTPLRVRALSAIYNETVQAENQPEIIFQEYVEGGMFDMFIGWDQNEHQLDRSGIQQQLERIHRAILIKLLPNRLDVDWHFIKFRARRQEMQNAFQVVALLDFLLGESSRDVRYPLLQMGHETEPIPDQVVQAIQTWSGRVYNDLYFEIGRRVGDRFALEDGFWMLTCQTREGEEIDLRYDLMGYAANAVARTLQMFAKHTLARLG